MQQATTDQDAIDVCPGCGSARIYTRTKNQQSGQAVQHGDERYRCRECGETFDTPDTKPRNENLIAQQGLARTLAEADPEDVSGGA